ncbi:MAG: serine/threonine protein kinase [Phycisphaeraceae bacterium]|nr:serine/threonine protein kinase [Phycisphaeraceae bacterium]
MDDRYTSDGITESRVARLFHEAISLDVGAREAFLDRLGLEEPDAASEVRALIKADAAGTTSFLAQSPGRGIDSSTPIARADTPTRIGPYTIERRLGEGGMGIVYLAHQDRPRRQVAVKVIRPEGMSQRAVARFAAEAELLGRLNHPGIATILEAGTDTSGPHPRHYLAMEYVEGRPLAAFAGGLDLRRKMALVADIAGAVHHAHQRGVIHRDLKPANVIVTPEGRPKVLDFGIARTIGTREIDATLRTATGHIVGTLEYLSPEQVGADPSAVDTRTDVYALGAIAYELVTGGPPFDFQRLALFEAMRLIRERGPRPIEQAAPACDRDAATIIAKAMALEPGRRYASASELAADIRRYLAGEPIEARRSSVTYRVTKFASANRTLVGGIGAFVGLLVVALVVLSFTLGQVRRERDEKQRQIETLSGLNSFFIDDLLSLSDPWEAGQEDVRLIDALERASAGLGDRLAAAPEVEAKIRLALGRMYINVVRLDEASTQLERAVALVDSGGVPDREAANILGTLSMLRRDQDRQDEALLAAARALDLVRSRLPDDHGMLLEALVERGSVLYRLDRTEEAIAVFTEAYELGKRGLPGDSRTLAASSSLSVAIERDGRLAEARQLGEEVVEGYRRVLGPEHPDTLTAANNLAIQRSTMGDNQAAEALFREVLEARRRTLGSEHADTLVSMVTLAQHYLRVGRFNDGLPLAIGAAEGLARSLGAGHRYTRNARRTVVRLYEAAGRADEASPWRDAP